MSNIARKSMDVDPMMTELSDDQARVVVGGPTAVEYHVMLSLIIAVCIAAIYTLGGRSPWGR